MSLDYERLEVYQAAPEMFDPIDEIVEKLPRGRRTSRRSALPSCLSIVNHIAEGA
jgi:hypothetical protein